MPNSRYRAVSKTYKIPILTGFTRQLEFLCFWTSGFNYTHTPISYLVEVQSPPKSPTSFWKGSTRRISTAFLTPVATPAAFTFTTLSWMLNPTVSVSSKTIPPDQAFVSSGDFPEDPVKGHNARCRAGISVSIPATFAFKILFLASQSPWVLVWIFSPFSDQNPNSWTPLSHHLAQQFSCL